MAITRIYLLARELGVSSTAILKKCQDEGLDIKNHMATISAGLAATIREWFSEGEHTTTIETAQKVDLDKARVRRARGKKLAQEEPIAPPPEQQAPESPAVEPQVVSTAETIGAPPSPVAPPPVEAPAAPVVKVAEVAAPPEKPKVQKVEPKPEPKPIMPAGPMLKKPAPAKLTGPRVVRIEAPEPAPVPRRPKPRFGTPVTEPLMGFDKEEDEVGATSGKSSTATPKHSKERTHGRRRTGYDAETAKRTQLLTQRREKDLEERKARLDAAGSE